MCGLTACGDMMTNIQTDTAVDTLNMSQKQRMLANTFYEHLDDELTGERNRAAELTHALNQLPEGQIETRRAILSDLLGAMGDACEIKSNFRCDYGYNILLGDRVFFNYDCTLVDCNTITIGDDTLLAPGVTMSCAYHPTDPVLRQKKYEAAAPIVVGKNVWIGAGAIIGPGVTIGDNTTIGAGSIVTRDVPSNVVAVGNPCRPIKTLEMSGVV